MEYTAVFEERVALTPRDIRGQIKNIDTVLEGKLRVRLEGKCSRHGFVLADTTKILSRSMGSLERGRFTGNLLFHVQAEGKVLNPPDKTILNGEVIRKNKMGLYVNYRDAIRIIVPRDANIGNDEFESVEVGETITVEIKKSRFQVNDEYILSVGLFIGRSGESTKSVVDDAESVPEEEVAAEEVAAADVADVAAAVAAADVAAADVAAAEEEVAAAEEEVAAADNVAAAEEEVAVTAAAEEVATAATATTITAAKRPFQIRKKAVDGNIK